MATAPYSNGVASTRNDPGAMHRRFPCGKKEGKWPEAEKVENNAERNDYYKLSLLLLLLIV